MEGLWVFLFGFSLKMLFFHIFIYGYLWLLCFAPVIYQPKRILSSPYALGLALPGLILIRKETCHDRILAHEFVHQQQMRRWTPIGCAIFLGYHYIGGFLQQLRTRRPLSFYTLYQSNPLEIEANTGTTIPNLPKLSLLHLRLWFLMHISVISFVIVVLYLT